LLQAMGMAVMFGSLPVVAWSWTRGHGHRAAVGGMRIAWAQRQAQQQGVGHFKHRTVLGSFERWGRDLAARSALCRLAGALGVCRACTALPKAVQVPCRPSSKKTFDESTTCKLGCHGGRARPGR